MVVARPAFDPKALLLYVHISQVFKIWFVPGFSAPVKLVTLLELTSTLQPSSRSSVNGPTRYLIKSQNDLYQVNEFVKFFSVFRVIWVFVLVWQFVATAMCVLGAVVFSPMSWVEENVIGGNQERSVKDVLMG